MTNIAKMVELALWEDLKDIGDITADNLISKEQIGSGRIFAKADGIVAGTEFIAETFKQVDSNITFDVALPDGTRVIYGDTIATFSGAVVSVLKAERTILNFLGHLSGIATLTSEMMTIAKPYGTTIACTRKTTPMLRNAEKFAVKSGGGDTHRFGLYDAVMIKDNHLVACPNLIDATNAVRASVPKGTKIEVEVDTLEQLQQVLIAKPDVVLLDNMSPDTIKKAIEITNKTCLLEASGNITPDTLKSYCETGVDIVSMGWLTHSAKNLDVSLELLLTQS